ncbi:RHS repeat-associated core domain-containing protein [Sorangium sp. So ce1153]|uniref:RHS repeat-associated core domain-containing protein n=1 Tax=Sorangium sp. So ce1153 TaxID=3133333 RepID=UPI003F62A93F
MVETKTVDTSGPFTVTPRVRYQLDNHLGSASLEVDGAGLVIGHEEYHLYETTAYWSTSSAAEVSRKRYRYTGKEKDEETGLYYYGARYYAPWLGRWTSADPAGLEGGLNFHEYAASNPVRFMDPNGRKPLNPNDPNVQRLCNLGLSDTDIQKLVDLGPTARSQTVDTEDSGGPGESPKRRTNPNPSPSGLPPGPTGSGRPSDTNILAGPGEHHGAGAKGSGNAEGNGRGTGPGNTLLDFAVFVMGIMGMQLPSEDGVSGGIPGGSGGEKNASATGQAAWLTLNVAWGKAVGAFRKIKSITNSFGQRAASRIEQWITKKKEERSSQEMALLESPLAPEES